MPKETWTTLHESVIVGYFCQAVGWIARDTWNQRTKDVSGRKLDALNLSHNPFDPAVGDLLLKAKSTEEFPQEYYVFELKVDWHKGVQQERGKLAKKSGTAVEDFDDARAEAFSRIPKANTAHLYGAIGADPTGSRPGKWLFVAPYWEAVRAQKNLSVQPLVMKLSALVKNQQPNTGFNIEELESYLHELNKDAVGGSRAATGSVFLVYAVKEYEQYLLDEQMLLSLFAHHWRCKFKELQAEQEAEETLRQTPERTSTPKLR